MWPWEQPATSSPSFQPPTAFPHQHVHHVTPPAPLHPVNPQGASAPSPYAGYQPQHFPSSVSAAAVATSPGGGELSHSHSHPGIGYGIPGMVSLSVPSPWNQEGGLSHPTSVISPHSTDHHSLATGPGTPTAGGAGSVSGVPGTSPVALPFHSPHDEMTANLSHLGAPSVSPTSYVGAPPPNPSGSSTPTVHQVVVQPPSGQEPVTLVSPSFATAPPPSQQPQQHTGTPPHHPHSLTSPQPHTYPTSSPGAVPPQAQHIHSSSPFSVDYLLHGNPPPNVVDSLGGTSGQGGLSDGGHDPSPYNMRSQSGSFTGGSGHTEMRQDIPTGGWSLIMNTFNYMYMYSVYRQNQNLCKKRFINFQFFV